MKKYLAYTLSQEAFYDFEEHFSRLGFIYHSDEIFILDRVNLQINGINLISRETNEFLVLEGSRLERELNKFLKSKA
ncbi:hypothetical protein J4440_03850 [Candidatus Woesearchaeota archaeon]|nr:hypothetical protein [Candidatus Woesearchaeota archaeon]